MAFWNRNKKNTDVPAEIQEYYQAERRERTGIAWLLALGTLLVTIILALAIFFAGRWVWRTVTNNDDSQTKTTQTDQGSSNTQGSGSNNGAGSSEGNATPPDEENSTSQNNDSDADDSHSPNALPADQTDGSQSATTPTTGSDIPETGPGNMVAVFAVTSVLGYLAHRRYILARK